MVDAEVVLLRLEVLRTNLRRLRQVLDLGRSTLVDDEDVQLRAERALQLALQAMLDIGTHVIASEGLDRPQRYQEILPVLAEAGILDQALVERLRGSAGMRNILVHDYLAIDHRRLFDDIESGIEDLEAFAKGIARLLS